MPRKPQKSPFQRLREQSDAKANIVSINKAKQNIKANGKQDRDKEVLYISWPDLSANGGIASVNASRLLDCPNLVKVFVDALKYIGRKRAWSAATLKKKLMLSV
jgi:hypothetical protein